MFYYFDADDILFVVWNNCCMYVSVNLVDLTCPSVLMSYCLRVGPRNNSVWDPITSLAGQKLPWVGDDCNAISLYFVQCRSFKCHLDAAHRGHDWRGTMEPW